MVNLSEQYAIYQDQTYRRQTKGIVIAAMNSIMPKGYNLDPRIYAGGGNPLLTFNKVRDFFVQYPGARHRQLPMHWYTEYLDDDYVTFVGLPFTNSSWWLQEMVRLGALPPVHADAFLIVTQENYSIETMEKRFWEHLAHHLVAPLLRDNSWDRQRVHFFEKIVDRSVVDSKDYPYLFAEPRYLDPDMFDFALKEYQKR